MSPRRASRCSSRTCSSPTSASSVTGEPSDESLAVGAAPATGQRVIGAITMSKLGVGQFDDDDLRLLEVARRARVGRARERAAVRVARREAENAKAWLEFSDAVSEARSVEAVGDETVRTIGSVMEVEQARSGSRTPRRATSAASRRSATTTTRGAAAVPALRTSRANAARADRPQQDAVHRSAPTRSARSSPRTPAARRSAPRRSRRSMPASASAAGSPCGRRTTTWRTSPTSGCACSRASPTARRSRCRRPCCSSPSRRAPR